jgi:hypothetical protein
MEVAVAVAVQSAIVAEKRAISLGLAQMRAEAEVAMEVEVEVEVEVMVASAVAAVVAEPGDIHFQYLLSDNVVLMKRSQLYLRWSRTFISGLRTRLEMLQLLWSG